MDEPDLDALGRERWYAISNGLDEPLRQGNVGDLWAAIDEMYWEGYNTNWDAFAQARARVAELLSLDAPA